ncbi:MAG TPA: PQQ-binding-like beta-propeller repeat protein [Thermoguttaceae bacterium]|nr:PQQ-binding-like beta-propeller repeat protein [Thermoguttaceae bacterium]
MTGEHRCDRSTQTGGRRPRLSEPWGLLWLALAVAATGSVVARAADWPTYRHDVARSGITAEQVQPPLVESWVFQPRHAPEPAWGDPKTEPVEGILELRRVHFDDAFQVAVAKGAVYFSSSANGKVYSLDAATGRVRWTRLTDGPIRLAPTVAEGRVYVGSDDGHAYCFAADGSLVWKFRAAPDDQRVLGSGKMVSLWPLRSGVLVDDGVAYLSAGIFPAEGVFLYALDAQDGRKIWCNDTCGETPQSRISPQGYLLASKSTIYAPMARVSPSAFDRATGNLKYPTLFFGKPVGGTYALLAGEDVYTGTREMVGYRAESRDRFAAFDGRKLVVTDETAYVATGTHLMALNRKTFPAASRKLQSLQQQKADADRAVARQATDQLKARAAALAEELKKAEQDFAAATRWKIPFECHESLILAGGVLFAGGTDQVAAVEAATGKTPWTGRVEGTAKGLAAAAGRLFVSTDKGMIYSFGPQGSPQIGTVAESVDPNPFAGSPSASTFEKAAERILQMAPIKRGYCLVLGLETGQLALELAERTELMVYAVDPNADKVAAARKAIDAAGLAGTRVCVEQWPLDKIPYADYFANLIVSETAVLNGELPPGAKDVSRMLKPLGGTMITQRKQGGDDPAKFRWDVEVREAIPGGGAWTHQFANAANTACGDDQAVKTPLGVLWFGRPGPGNMVNRHARAASPISIDGRLFIQGENLVMAYDVYNGLKLWERKIPGAMRTNASHDGSNLAASRDGLFVAVGDKCLRLDPKTGETTATYQFPPVDDGKSGRWGYVATVGGLLYGGRCTSGRESDLVFAIDVQSGKHRWVHKGTRIPHIAISIGEGRVLLVDRGVSDEERKQAIDDQGERISKLPQEQQAAALARLEKADVQKVCALDAATGAVLWQRPLDLTDCGGGNLATMSNNGVLVIFGVYLDGHYWQQFFAGEFASRRVTALSAADGSFLWSQPVGFRVRPIVVGDTLHAEPWAFDLHTGEPRTRTHPVTGETDRWQFARPGHHCGCPIASPNCLFFRSYCLGYYDLVRDYGTMHFGAQRPGCWVNAIPSGGLLLMPEASAGCMCPFPNMCTVVFRPTTRAKGFAYYSAPGPMTPVKRLAVNLGAPGDRADTAGNLWLGYPRPGGSLVLQFKVDVAFHSGGGFDQHNSAYTPIAGTDDDWLFASAARGLRKCVLPLLDEGDGTAQYRVRLAFADSDNDQPGQRVFDVKLQGNVVLKDFDVVEAAGGRDRAVFKEFGGIEVSDKLTIELVPKAAKPTAEQTTILQGVEVVRERITSLGCAVPDFLLSTLAPKGSGEMSLANLRESPFEGTLRMTAPEGFAVEPKEVKVKLASGGRTTIPLAIALRGEVAAGDYEIPVKLVAADGTVELERSVKLEHLGRRGRVVLKPAEDAFVSQRYPDKNQGTGTTLLVDGGNAKMADTDHSLALVKFRLDVPGKPVEARFRIHNAGNPTGNSGRVCLADGAWTETGVTYSTRPKAGQELAQLGRISENQVVEVPIKVDLSGKTELSLIIDPTTTDGVDYLSRESAKPPELTIEYEPSE